MKLLALTKGICDPNPQGDSACAVEIYEIDERGRECPIYQRGAYIGKGEGLTNFVAAYRALIHALKYLEAHFYREEVEIYCDLRSVVLRVNGEPESMDTEDHLAPLCAECRELLLNIPRATIAWMPRERLEPAGVLARHIISEQQGASE